MSLPIVAAAVTSFLACGTLRNPSVYIVRTPKAKTVFGLQWLLLVFKNRLFRY